MLHATETVSLDINAATNVTFIARLLDRKHDAIDHSACLIIPGSPAEYLGPGYLPGDQHAMVTSRHG